ncbi:hypothetical protein H2198_008165 [Neophaeococcomyces mojaviensis]|uniref:Uncharacterized protein n=1 Tax=Neophaeococcomyces mojaviensis TaxID=3383035 RepID=A0ACC2ZY75_9EURO|nr:hypothetical protein H2198_008165 [Knufia sp. JES_112]
MAKRITSILSIIAAATSVNAHAFFHSATVNGASQGQLFGVRAPSSNSPIQDVSSSAITCNSPLHSPVSTDVIEVAPGDSFGMQWNHNIGGPTAGDSDDPIASSHKGPVMAYMAKVSDASTNDGSGLAWFKVAEEGLDTSTGTWGVDTLISNAGLWSFTMPNLAPGDYLLRGEIIALHSAGSTGGAQFYMSCAAIRVTGSGTCSPSSTVSFPGAYSASDPGILISIYGNDGKPTNGGKSYTIPGPAVATCDGSSSASTTKAFSATSSSSAASMTTTSSISVSSSLSTKLNAVSTTTTSAGLSSVEATTKPSASASTTTTYSLPTTFATITSSRDISSHGSGNYTWSAWSYSNTRTRSAGNSETRTRPAGTESASVSSKFSLSASGQPETSVQGTATVTRSAGSGHHDSSPSPSATKASSVEITASASATGVKVPSASAGETGVEATSAAPTTSTSPAKPSGSGYSMTGADGRKFMCYEILD